MITSEELQRMVIDITTGRPDPPENTEHSIKRKQLRKEIQEIKEKGGIVDIPGEIM